MLAAAAEAVPGVVAIVTSENVTDHVNPMPDFGPSPDKHTWHCLAVDKVRYMGEGVAVVAATIAAMMARVTGRPVKFMQDRLDNIANGDHHGSDRYYEAELAARSDGTMLSARFKVVDNYGA